MNRNALFLAVLAALLLMAGVVMAQDAVTETEVPAVEETTETEGSGSLAEWLAQGWNAVIDPVTEGFTDMEDGIVSGWTEMTDAVVNGWNSVVEFFTGPANIVSLFTEYQNEVETYMKENNWTEEAENAWNTLKEGAEQAGAVTKEEAEKAYETIVDWFVQTGETIDQGYAAMIDEMAAASGVAQAELSNWYRKVEAYVTTESNNASDAVKEAWTTVKQGTLELGNVTVDQLETAAQTLRDWLKEQNTTDAEEAAEALDGIVNQK